ncbi:MAG: PAS domain S-box protein [Deltaproteobacteria bacterium]|nr:PAS domain S-box protein [Deltaproteobacteria bacterium]
MPRFAAKTLFLPVIGLLAAAMVLLAVLAVTTYLNLDRAGKQAERILAAQGTAVVSGLAAGLRTGWRFWTWRPESLQGLIHEMSQSSDVAFITLLNNRGVVLAHSNPELTGRVLENYHQITSPLRTDRIVSWFQDGNLYLSGRRLKPLEFRRPGMTHRPGMREHKPGIMRNRPEGLFEFLEPRVILIGLKTDAYISSRQDQFHRALIMGGLLFLVGFGAIYLIFILQNYRTIDRTLSNLSTYTAGIVDNMPNGLITFNPHEELVMINRAAREIFAWGDADEKRLADQPVIKALAEEFLPRLAQGRSVLDQEFEVSTKDGRSIPLAVSVAAVPSGAEGRQGSGAVFILRDLSQIKDLEEQVRQSEKLAAMGRLAAGMAHEVRNPLSSMRGLARFLARDLDETSREAEYLKVMVFEIDRLNRVMNSLLDFARPREPDLKPTDLNEVVKYTLGLVSDDARHQGVSIVENLTQDPLIANADRDQVIQAVLNILLNGIEAMPHGGLLKVTSYFETGFALVKIEDTGPGIDLDDRSRLFDPFYTTKDQGTGLGLAQVARIMEIHGGRVVVGGQAGHGAVFSLHFPRP